MKLFFSPNFPISSSSLPTHPSAQCALALSPLLQCGHQSPPCCQSQGRFIVPTSLALLAGLGMTAHPSLTGSPSFPSAAPAITLLFAMWACLLVYPEILGFLRALSRALFTHCLILGDPILMHSKEPSTTFLAPSKVLCRTGHFFFPSRYPCKAGPISFPVFLFACFSVLFCFKIESYPVTQAGVQ